MKHALDAIRDTARIAWWDGSALGLRLNRLMDIFGTEDAEHGIEPAKIRS